MMHGRELYNAEITLRPDRLNFPLVQWHAAQLSSFRFRIVRAPTDILNLRVRVGVPGSSNYYLCPCAEHACGEWTGCAVPGVFAAAGETQYEVVAVDANGHETFLGRGLVSIAARVPGDEVVATVFDDQGVAHKLTAINIDDEWTLRLD